MVQIDSFSNSHFNSMSYEVKTFLITDSHHGVFLGDVSSFHLTIAQDVSYSRTGDIIQ